MVRLFDLDDGPGAPSRAWVVVECDGGARGNPGPAAIGAVVTEPDPGGGDSPHVLATVSEYIGETTNNVAEYRAVIAGLEAAVAFPSRGVRVQADSMLVIRQLEGAWRVKQPHLRSLHAEAKRLLEGWDRVELAHVPRERNVDADLLVNAALDARVGPRPPAPTWSRGRGGPRGR